MPGRTTSMARTPALLLLLASVAVPSNAVAQGIGLSLTPSVEEARWGEDLLIPSTVFPGLLASAHFGRFVSLDAHYFQSRSQEVPGSPAAIEARRWGGDIFVALAPTPLAPFVRLGAGVLEFQAEEEGSVPSRHLAASFGGGLRIAVRERLSGELSVRRLAFRVGPGSGVVEDDGSGAPPRDIGTYAIGAGLRIPLGGTWQDPETDDAVRNVSTLSVPIRLFGGDLSFDESLGLRRHPIAGAMLGVDLGPYVGTSLYAFGSARDGLSSPETLYGYGLEGSFNFTRRGTGLTPHLILGGGRVHFTEADRVIAGLDGRKKWTATVGAGLDFALTDRFRGEVAARNLVLTQRGSADVSSPEELRGNWLLSAGVRFVLGSGRRGAGATASERPSPAAPSPRTTSGDPTRNEEAATDALSEDVAALEEERDRLIAALEVERLRQALALLREQGDATAAERLLAEYRGGSPAPPSPRTFELPVLEEGEFRVRFGPDSRGAATDTAGAVSAGADAATAADPRLDQLLERVSRMEGRLDEIADRPDVTPAVPANVQVDVQTPGASVAAPAESMEARPRGVFRGEAPGLRGGAVFVGGRVEPSGPGVVGLEVDIGSALGGGIRVRPGLSLGFLGDFIWGVGADVAWPLPFTAWAVRPSLTAGLGILREDGITRVMIPNVGIELGREIAPDIDAYVAYQTFDLLDHQRLVAGVRLRPAPRDAMGVNVAAASQGGRSDPAGLPTPEEVDEEPVPDSTNELEAGGQELRGQMDELRSEVARLREGLDRAERAAREAEARAEEAEAEARRRESEETPPPPPEPSPPATPPAEALLERLRPLEGLESVQTVRRGSDGVAVVLGGGVTYPVGRAELSALAHSEIGRIAEILLQVDYPIMVEGHTDATGGADTNLRLSQARAEAVRGALLGQGLAPSRITATGFGQSRPVATNETAEGRAANRRVEIVVRLPASP